MRYEWKKISGYVLALLVLAIAANAWLFYQHCTDTTQSYTLKQLQLKFHWSVEELEEENAVLEPRFFSTVSSNSDVDNSLLTGSLGREISLNDAILERLRLDYSAYLDNVQAESDFRIQSGMFGDENSFAVRSMQKTQEIYRRLAGLPVTPAFSGVPESLLGWQLSDLFFLFFACAPSLFLLTQERRSGLLALLRPLKHGHGVLYIRKFAAMTGMVLLGFFLLYGANLAIAINLYGTGNLSLPIQSIYGFHTCPMPLTIAGYLILLLGTKLLWGWCVGAIFFALCAAISQIPALFGVAIGILALSLGMGASSSLWLRALSLSRLASTEALYLQCLFLDFFGIPVRQLPVSIGFLALLILVCFAVGWAAFVRKPVGAATKRMGALRLHGLSRHTNIFLHEGQKLWITHGALLLTIVLIAVQVMAYRNFSGPNDPFSYYYKKYAETLSGEPCAASDRYLVEERARFDRLHEEASSSSPSDGESLSSASEREAQLQNELLGEEAFLTAKRQYESLQEGQQFVYRTGYERLCDLTGRLDDLRNAIKLLLYLILAFSGVFAVERETGMDVLLQSSGARWKVALRKLLNCAIVLVIGFGICFLPQYFAVRANYGLPNLGARANSLEIFVNYANGWTLRGVLLFKGFIQLLISTAAGAVILFFSKKTGNRITTLLLSVGILVLPALTLLLFAT